MRAVRSRSVSTLLALSIGAASVAACGGPGQAKSPADSYARRLFPTGYTPVLFAVAKHETAPPGFVPVQDHPGAPWLTTVPTKAGGGGGVVTLAVWRDRGPNVPKEEHDPLGPLIEHVDDTAPVISVERGMLSRERAYPFFVPLVGPGGQRLSRAFEIHCEDKPTLKPLGDPIPRVIVLPSAALPLAVEGPEPGLYLGISTKTFRPAQLPKGALGGMPSHEGWTIRWSGERGEGWSYSWYGDMSDVKDGPVWKTVRSEKLSEGWVLVGERIDGQGCDVRIDDLKAPSGTERVLRAKACDEALASMDTKMKAARGAANTAEAKAQAERNAQNARAIADRQEAERQRGEQSAREREQQAKDEAVIRTYLGELKAGKVDAACITATSGLSKEAHLKMLAARVERLFYKEIDCFESRANDESSRRAVASLRTQLNERWERDQRVAEEQAAEARRAERRATKRAINAAGPKPATETHQQYMKRMNDYTYGSGQASSCPYQDKSMCR